MSWLVFGIAQAPLAIIPPLYYDIILGIFGMAATLTAAYDFKDAHEKVAPPFR